MQPRACHALATRSPRPAVQSTPESGVALLMALFFTVVVVGLIGTGTLLLRSHAGKSRTAFALRSQALQVARSGLTEAANWLRRQTSQPVLAFDPQFDPGAVPPLLDTIDADIGIVREFRITGRVWARYEVWKEWPGDPDPDRLAWREQFQCQDVSAQRAGASPGTIWRLRSVGYVYERENAAVPFDQQPNRVIASQVAVDEVRRLVIALPGEAAVNVARGDDCRVEDFGRIVGGAGAGVYFPQGTGTAVLSGGQITGSPAQSTAVDYDDSCEAVFGMGFQQLQAMASLQVTTTSQFPKPVPDMSLVVVDIGTLTLDSSRPLVGTGIVVVRGDVVINPGSNSNFSGMLYVDGDLTVNAPAEIRGAVVCTGDLRLEGISDYASVYFDSAVLTTLLTQIGNYRQASAVSLPRLSR